MSVGSCPALPFTAPLLLQSPQSPQIAYRMRVWIVANVLMLALGLATSFRVPDVIETFEDFVEDENLERQSDLNDNIPAVFAATLGASLLANVLFGGGSGPSLNKIGIHFYFHFTPLILLQSLIDCKCGVETENRIIGGQDVAFVCCFLF